MERIREFLGVQLRRGFRPILSALQWLRITPNQISTVGLVLNVGAAALVLFDHLIYAGIVFLVAGCFDLLDGALARRTGKSPSYVTRVLNGERKPSDDFKTRASAALGIPAELLFADAA